MEKVVSLTKYEIVNHLSESSRYAMVLLLALPLVLTFISYLIKRLYCRTEAKSQVKLAPAEMAFLARDGDMTHTMVVLGFDLFHRALKVGDSDGDLLLPYEKELWKKTKEFLRDKAKQHVDKVNPLPKSSNPLVILTKLSGSYKVLTTQVRQVVQQILKDPRHLKAYFSPAALGRFAADVLSAPYKELISSEITSSLTTSGLILNKNKQEALSAWLLIIAAIGFAVIINVAWRLVPNLNAFVIVLIAAVVNAVCFKLVMSISTMLPLYNEVTSVLDHISHSNLAVRFCRILSFIIRTLLIALIAMFILLLVCVDLLVLLVFTAGMAQTLLFDVLLLSISCLSVLSIVLDSVWIRSTPALTDAGKKVIEQRRKAYSKANIVESFKNVLTSSDYDGKVSEMLAVYGYETLWLLT